MRLFAARGFDLVIGVGFIFSSDVDASRATTRACSFACVDYAPPPDGHAANVRGARLPRGRGLVPRRRRRRACDEDEARRLRRRHDIPLIRKFEAGYAAGVKAACSACTVHVAYAGATPDAFRDPAKGKALAIARSPPAPTSSTTRPARPVTACSRPRRTRARWAIGVDADQYDEMPGTVLTSMVKRADVAVFDAIRDVQQRRFQPGVHELGLKEGAIGYVEDGPHGAAIPADVKTEVDALGEDVKSGRIRVPRD